MRKIILALSFLLFATTSHSSNGANTGVELLRNCKAAVDNSNIVDGFSCIYFANGVRNGIELALMLSSKTEEDYLYKRKSFHCAPDEITNLQLAMVIRRYLENNPAKLHLPATYLVLHALRDAFPCDR